MQTVRTGAVFLLLVAGVPATAQDHFPDVEYISGWAGIGKKVKGTLVVEATALKFMANDGKSTLEIPMANVVSATATKEQEAGSFGRKMALGIFASKTEEYLQVETRTADSADAVIFKTKKKQAPGMAAKINFFREQQPKP